MQISIRKLGTVAMLAVGALFTQAASAEEYSLPGLSCVRSGSAGIVVFEGMRLENSSTVNTLTLICPLVRAQPDATSLQVMEIGFVDNNDDDGIRCHSVSCDIHTNNCDFSAELLNPPGALDLMDGDPHGLAALICTVPPDDGGNRSGLEGYVWND